MTEAPQDPNQSLSTTLARGKACLRCRKRKMRCDGSKPACAQCMRAKKPDGCQYDDGKGKTRTQALREKIMKLEEQISQMRDPDYQAPSVMLHDPHSFPYSSSSSSSAAGSPSSTGLSVAASPYGSFVDPVASPHSTWDPLRSLSPAVIPSNEEPSLELSQMLLEIALPRRRQIGLVLNPSRLRTSLLSDYTTDRRHPFLTNAIYLWSCFLSRPGPLSQHELHYLSRAQESFADAIAQRHRIVDVVQGSCLIARYMYACGRLAEASVHASTAATMAVHAGLHRTAAARPWVAQWNVMEAGTSVLQVDQTGDVVEVGERVLVFWQAYVLDRLLAVALQRPTVIADDDGVATRVDVPWPEDVEEYASMNMESILGDSTLRMYSLHQGVASGGFSMQALQVKAAMLFEGAMRLSQDWGNSSSTHHDFNTYELTISRFISNLLPIHQLDGALPDDRRELVTMHTMAHTAYILLHQRFAARDSLGLGVSGNLGSNLGVGSSSLEKCVTAARGVALLVKHVADSDFEYLDPIIGTCWSLAAYVFALKRSNLDLDGNWAAASTYQSGGQEFDTLVYAMTKLGARYPIANFQVGKILQSIALS